MNNVLYHYTSRYHLEEILKSNYLKLTESNLLPPDKDEIKAMKCGKWKPKPEHLLHKPVVWLTRSVDGSMTGLEGSKYNKREIRITLNKRKHYEMWLIWSRQNRIKSSWAKVLERNNNPNEWYISEQIILLNPNELIMIENTLTGEVIVDNSNYR